MWVVAFAFGIFVGVLLSRIQMQRVYQTKIKQTRDFAERLDTWAMLRWSMSKRIQAAQHVSEYIEGLLIDKVALELLNRLLQARRALLVHVPRESLHERDKCGVGA